MEEPTTQVASIATAVAAADTKGTVVVESSGLSQQTLLLVIAALV